MTKDGLPGEASQEGQSRPVSLAGLVLVLCVALMGVMGVSITLPILPKLGAVFHQDAAGVALLITCFTLPSAFMTPVAGVLADRFGRKAVLLPGCCCSPVGEWGALFPIRSRTCWHGEPYKGWGPHLWGSCTGRW